MSPTIEEESDLLYVLLFLAADTNVFHLLEV